VEDQQNKHILYHSKSIFVVYGHYEIE
jgi:hypothetical protein